MVVGAGEGGRTGALEGDAGEVKGGQLVGVEVPLMPFVSYPLACRAFCCAHSCYCCCFCATFCCCWWICRR